MDGEKACNTIVEKDMQVPIEARADKYDIVPIYRVNY